MNLPQILDGLMELGYDRYRFDGQEPNVTCSLFLYGYDEPVIKTTGAYALQALRQALQLALNPPNKHLHATPRNVYLFEYV